MPVKNATSSAVTAEPVRRVRRKPPPPERSKAPLVAAAVVGALLAIGAAVLIAVRSGVFS